MIGRRSAQSRSLPAEADRAGGQAVSKDIEIAVEVRAVTDKAIQVYDGKTETWVPKSQISNWCDGPDEAPGTDTTPIFIPEWLATAKGLL